MLKERLEEKAYLPILRMTNGEHVTEENWYTRRREMLALLERYSYGKTLPPPIRVWDEPVGEINYIAYAGKVIEQRVNICFETEGEKKPFKFPVDVFIPKSVEKPPVILHIAFRPVPDRYIPVEEITDMGYALVVMTYTDIVNDNHYGDFSGGIAAYFKKKRARTDTEWGKIGMWAYGASRVMDFIKTREDLDGERVAVSGHSRLGKTALWCGAQDERFAAVISNNSGYGGAASSKRGKGERITDFIRLGSDDWYCEFFKAFRDQEDDKPYDQSFLLALVAPRYLLVCSAEEDYPADPEAEFLTSLHASCAWELLGARGLVTPDRLPIPGDKHFEGNLGYYIRTGTHFLSRADWAAHIEFLDKKFKK